MATQAERDVIIVGGGIVG
ncbi:MAG: hypothetical protein KDB87_06445, partial [Flavobacteriales bacterium]|nr:hypothetical protein [Flavobacteriales bacterium]